MNNQLQLRQKILTIALSDKQLEAATIAGASVLVSASAGSGKTSVLATRVVSKILLKQSSIKNILALTFTNAAANEMKVRIQKMLQSQKQWEVPSDEAILKHVHGDTTKSVELKKIYQLLQPLNITDLAYIENELSEVQQADITTIDAFARSILERFYSVLENFDFSRMNNMITKHQKEMILNKSIKEAIYELVDNQYISHYSGLAKTLQYVIPKTLDYEDPVLKIAEFQHKQNGSDEINQVLLNKLAVYRSEIYKLLKYVDFTLKGIRNKDKKEAYYNFLISIMHDFTPENFMQQKPFKFSSNYKKLDDVISKAYELCEIITNNKKADSILYELLKNAYTKYDTLKKQEKLIEFSDITRYAVQILQQNENIRKQYQEHFNEILVDEFQDTNEIQDSLIRLISKNNSNIFRVGDVKQSIYRFRSAKPQMMENYYRQFENSDAGINVVLETNYRSQATIIEFNNALFQKLMNVEHYPTMFDMEKDYAKAVKYDKLHSVVYHEIDDIKKLSMYDYIASEISKNANGNYNQYAILLRNNSAVKDVLQALRAKNVPCYGIEDINLYDCEFIQLLINVLKLRTNKNDKMAFSSVYTSVLFQNTLEQLSKVHLNELPIDENYQSLMTTLQNKNNVHDIIQTLLNHRVANQYIYEHYLDKTSQLAINYLQAQLRTESIENIEQALEWLQQLKNSEFQLPCIVDSNDNVVKVMTIHKSKGLEFEVVYLPITDEAPKSDNVSCVLNDDLGVAFYHQESDDKKATRYTEAVKIQNQYNNVSESLRVLYVATTRAKTKLHFVSKKIKNTPELDIHLLESGKKFPSYILANQLTLMHQTIKNIPLLQINEVDSNTYTPISIEVMNQELNYRAAKRFEKTVTTTNNYSAHTINTVPPLQTQEHYQRGTTLHQLIEYHGKNQTEPIKNQTVLNLYNNDQFKKCLTEEHYFEMPFIMKQQDDIISGYIDFVSIGECVTIIDFKTDQFSDYDTKEMITEQELKNRYAIQLNLYQKVLQKKYSDKEIVCFIYSTTLNSMIKVE